MGFLAPTKRTEKGTVSPLRPDGAHGVCIEEKKNPQLAVRPEVDTGASWANDRHPLLIFAEPSSGAVQHVG